ncbi:MAG: hypothetical protein J6W24_02385 [Prevotella sp.]|nr:hypothetical protein [Prevotella sp.]
MKKILFSLFALLLLGSIGMVKAQSVTGQLGSASTTHNDQFFTGKAVTVDLSTGGTVKLTATSGYGGESTYSVASEGLTLKLSSTPVEPVQVINPEGAEATYNVGSHVAASDLDFSGIEQNMKAYVATVVNGSKGTVTLAEAAAIKSGDAFVMRAEEKGWYCIPQGGSAAYEINEFKGNATEATALDAGKTYYALHKSGVFAKINTEKVQTVPAGRTYLEVTGNGAQSLAFIFGDDDATAIDNVNADDNADANLNVNNAYNLSGQRVGKGYKGIVIVGGRKIMLND